MADIVSYNEGPRNGKRLTEAECTEVYNALNDRINALKEDLAGTTDAVIPPRVRQSLEASLARCEKLVEVFE